MGNIALFLRDYSHYHVMARRKPTIISGTIVAQTAVEAGVHPDEVMKIESILCPTDLSPDSDEALRYAVALSRAYNAELLLLHCNTGDGSAPGEYDAAAQTIREALVKYSGDYDLSGLDWKSLVVTCEDVGEAIAREAAIYRVDLIVMRSRRRPHRAALLGSTAETVSRNAPCPVLVMHSDERDWVTGSDAKIELKRILVAYDFSDYSELALNSALSLAQEYQSDLHLLHVLPPFSLNESEISWYPLGQKAPIIKPRGVCKRPCRQRLIFGASSNTPSARASLTAKSSTTPKRTRSISYVWVRMAPDLGCALCSDRMSIACCVKRRVRCW